jgi:hypothetical protein
LTSINAFFMLRVCAIHDVKEPGMLVEKKVLLLSIACLALAACSSATYLKGGIHRQLDENLTIVSLTENPKNYLNKTIVFSIRFYKKGDLPCPLGEDYVNFAIADRVSYITLDKIWIRKDKAKVLDALKEMETIVMKARVFAIDKEKDPNLEALEIVPE